jgi:hypothetical protein
MKITRSELKKLILDTVHKNESILLEMPGEGGLYNYRDDDTSDYNNEAVDLTGQKLFHMARQADQLHDMLKGDDKVVDDVKSQIIELSDKLKEIFDAVIYDKQNPEGR